MSVAETRSVEGWLAFGREHLALALSLLLGIAVTLKLFVVAHGDPVTLSSLVAAQGLSGVFASAFLVGMPLFSLVLCWASVVGLMEAVREGDTLKGPGIGTAFATILGLLFVPMLAFLALLGWAALYLLTSLLTRMWRAKRVRQGRSLNWWLRSRPRDEPLRLFLVFALVVGAGAVVISDTPWMPRERVVLSNGSGEEVGFVLSEGDLTVSFLRDADRRVLQIPAAQVSAREVCRSTGVVDLARRSLLARAIWGTDIAYRECG